MHHRKTARPSSSLLVNIASFLFFVFFATRIGLLILVYWDECADIVLEGFLCLRKFYLYFHPSFSISIIVQVRWTFLSLVWLLFKKIIALIWLQILSEYPSLIFVVYFLLKICFHTSYILSLRPYSYTFDSKFTIWYLILEPIKVI